MVQQTWKSIYKTYNYNYETQHVLWDIEKNPMTNSVFVTTGATVSASDGTLLGFFRPEHLKSNHEPH